MREFRIAEPRTAEELAALLGETAEPAVLVARASSKRFMAKPSCALRTGPRGSGLG